MRERPKQPSYLERHKQVEESQPRSNHTVETRRSSSDAGAHLIPTLLPKKVDRVGAVVASRVRVGGSSRVVDKSTATANSSSGGRMTQFKSLDDIPDGLPESPQPNKSNTNSVPQNCGNYHDDEAEDYSDDHNSGYGAPMRNHPAGQPLFPSERASIDGYGPSEEKSGSRPGSNQLSKYPPLHSDSDAKNRPIVYPSSYNKSASKLNPKFREDDDDWADDDSLGDSLPPNQSKSNSYSQYDEMDEMTNGRSVSSVDRNKNINDDDPGSICNSRNKKNSVPLKPPPELPYEARPEADWKSEEANKAVDVKEQLYFSKQPRQIDYTPYTLGQYRQSNPKEYVEIVPRIKPDLNTDILKAKRANADRIKDFSKQLNEFNKNTLVDQKKLPYSSEASGVQICKKKMESNRERAMQFAKNIPRPAAKGAKNEPGGVEEDDIGERFMKGDDVDDEKASKLEELQAKHLESKRSIEAMRKAMGM